MRWVDQGRPKDKARNDRIYRIFFETFSLPLQNVPACLACMIPGKGEERGGDRMYGIGTLACPPPSSEISLGVPVPVHVPVWYRQHEPSAFLLAARWMRPSPVFLPLLWLGDKLFMPAPLLLPPSPPALESRILASPVEAGISLQ